jgi:hypothetical protein
VCGATCTDSVGPERYRAALRQIRGDCFPRRAEASGAPDLVTARDDDQERRGDSRFLAKEQSCRTA